MDDDSWESHADRDPILVQNNNSNQNEQSKYLEEDDIQLDLLHEELPFEEAEDEDEEDEESEETVSNKGEQPLNLHKYDLLDQCDGLNFVLVDLNALLWSELSRETYNGTLLMDWLVHGGQILHLVYAIEKILRGMKDRDMRFALVIMEDPVIRAFYQIALTEKGYSQEALSFALLGHSVLKEHIEKNLHLECVHFHGIPFDKPDPSFMRYLKKTLPAFIITDISTAWGLKFADVCLKQFLINLVVDIEFRGNRVFGFATPQKNIDHHQFLRFMETNVNAEEQSEETEEMPTPKPEAENDLQEFQGDVTSLASQLLPQDLLNAVACRVMISRGLAQENLTRVEVINTIQLSQLYMVSMLLARAMPLEARSFPLPEDNTNPSKPESISQSDNNNSTSSGQPTELTKRFLWPLYKTLHQLIKSGILNDVVPSLSQSLHDLADGRLFHLVASRHQADPTVDLGKLPESVQAKWTAVQKYLLEPCHNINITDNSESTGYWKSWISQNTNGIALKEARAKLLPLTNPLVDAYLKDFAKDMITEKKGVSGKPYLAATKYHSTRLLAEEDIFVARTWWQEEKQKKTQARLSRYAQTVNPLSKPKVVELHSKKSTEKITPSKSALQTLLEKFLDDHGTTILSVQNSTAEDEDSLTKQLAAIQEVLQQGYSLVTKLKQKPWESEIIEVLNQCFSLLDHAILFIWQKSVKLAKQALGTNASGSDCWNFIQAALFTFSLLCELSSKQRSDFLKFSTQKQTGKNKPSMVKPSSQRPHIKKVSQVIPPSFERNVAVTQYLMDQLSQAGFDDCAKSIFQQFQSTPSLKPAPSKSKVSPQFSSVGLSLTHTTANNNSTFSVWELQLEHNMYKYETEIFKYLPPPDLTNITAYNIQLDFIPDLWQRDLISKVNAQKSVLVSAPTSSGKTFLAFYVIEKVLRESEDGVVVFVTPTKALVNQVYAEVATRFQTTVGVFTSDDRINVKTSRVLVTLPATLEILLLSQTTFVWRKKLKYVILDEIHCISDSESGATWEHLGLSATIGNPVEFQTWLNQSKNNVELVQHKTRPRPLEYFVFDYTVKSVCQVHPISVLNPVALDVFQIQVMSPRQALEFVRVCDAIARQTGLKNPFEQFLPQNHFGHEFKILSRDDTQKFEEKIRHQIVEITLSQNQEAKDLLLQVIRKFQTPVHAAYSNNLQLGNNFSNSFKIKHMAMLITSMQEQKLLPALAFCFDRELCNALGLELKDQLCNLGQNLFRGQDHIYLSEIIATKKSLEDNPMVLPEILECLEYGIGIHHAGMPDDYLKEVERLFRSRKLPLIIGTGTLALGIHMPCKSVIMCGKSIYLNTIMFQQCCGRAGRRGFDDKGTIVLWDLPMSDMNRLLTAATPTIKGSIGLTPSFLLRLMTLYGVTIKTPNHELVMQDCLRVFQQPLFYLGKLSNFTLQRQVKHHIRFTLEFLQRQHLISNQGIAVDWAGLVNNLFYTEPANFLFVHFLSQGLFHKYIQDQMESRTARFDIQIGLLAILASLFNTVEVHKSGRKTKCLPPLPASFKSATRSYEKQMTKVYAAYLHSFCNTYPTQVTDNILPYSNFILPALTSDTNFDDFNDWKFLLEQADKPTPVSCFVSISGFRGPFAHPSDFCRTLKGTIALDETVLPFVKMKPKEMNAYVVEFYKHGDKMKVFKESHMKNPNDTNKFLGQMNKDIKKVKTQLALMLDENDQATDLLWQYINDISMRFNDLYMARTYFKRYHKKGVRLETTSEDRLLKGVHKVKEGYSKKDSRQVD